MLSFNITFSAGSISRLFCRFFHASFFFLFFFSLKSTAQDKVSNDTCLQRDLGDLIRQWRHKPPAQKTTKMGSLLLVPAISSNPATGFAFGAAG